MILKKFLILCLLLLTGCAANSKNFLKKMCKNYEDIEQYSVSGNIEINHLDITTKYNFETSYLSPDYLKVSLLNESNNTNQVIIKNTKGVYVLSPTINKTYKFSSAWPTENSIPYVVSSLVNDIINDKEVEIVEEEEIFIVKCVVKNQINVNLEYQEIKFDKEKLLPKEVCIYDKNDSLRIKVTFNEFNLEPNLSDGDFNVDANMTSLILQIGEGEENGEFSLPTYMPYDVTYTQKSLDDAILISYNGEDASYTIYQCYIEPSEVNVIIDCSGELVLLNNTIGVCDDNSLMWCSGGIEYKIYSDTLQASELIDIANSIV